MKNLNDLNNWLDIEEHQKIGEILMQCGSLSLEDLGIALDIQNFEKMPTKLQLGDILLNMKVISNETLNNALILQKQIDKALKERGL